MNKQNNDWRERYYNEFYKKDNALFDRRGNNVSYEMEIFIQTEIDKALKEILERVNKEVIEKTRSIKWGNPVSEWSKGYNDGIEDVIKFVYKNEKRKA